MMMMMMIVRFCFCCARECLQQQKVDYVNVFFFLLSVFLCGELTKERRRREG
jgi:hypothetical protein